jgi:hypothetical protein
MDPAMLLRNPQDDGKGINQQPQDRKGADKDRRDKKRL